VFLPRLWVTGQPERGVMRRRRASARGRNRFIVPGRRQPSVSQNHAVVQRLLDGGIEVARPREQPRRRGCDHGLLAELPRG